MSCTILVQSKLNDLEEMENSHKMKSLAQFTDEVYVNTFYLFLQFKTKKKFDVQQKQCS